MSRGKLIVKRSAQIDAAPSKVWRIIVSPELWQRWMLVKPELEGDQPLGLRSKVLWKDESGRTYLTGTVSVFEPNRKLVLDLEDISWTRKAAPGEVTYALTISEQGRGTHVEFMLGDLSIDPEGQKWRDAYAESRELEAIKELAEE